MRIRSLIREMILAEETLTVGDVRSALATAKGIRLKDAAGKAGKAITKKFLMSLVPGGGAIEAAIEAGMDVADIYGATKEAEPAARKKNPFLDMLTLDPETAHMVDDDVERNFEKEIGQTVASMPDESTMPDIDIQFNNWLRQKFGGRYVGKGA